MRSLRIKRKIHYGTLGNAYFLESSAIASGCGASLEAQSVHYLAIILPAISFSFFSFLFYFVLFQFFNKGAILPLPVYRTEASKVRLRSVEYEARR